MLSICDKLSYPFINKKSNGSPTAYCHFKKLLFFAVCLIISFFILIHYANPIPAIIYSTTASTHRLKSTFASEDEGHFHDQEDENDLRDRDFEGRAIDDDYEDDKPSRLRVQGTQRRLPGAIVIGVRKCGTRALIEMLNMHPDIQKRNTEAHFFDNDEKYSNGLEWYRKKMPYTFDNQITIEKTPSYFVSRESPARIKAMDENIKLLLIVRDPAMRVVSDYVQILESKRSKGLPYKPFHKLVLLPNGEINDRYNAVQTSQYVIHILRWLRVFPRNQIHIIDGDMLILNPYPEIRKVEKFLNLPSRIRPSNFYFNRTKGFYCMRNETFQKCLADSKGRKHPYVDPSIMEALRRYFAPFNEQFYQIVGQNFSWPTF